MIAKNLLIELVQGIHERLHQGKCMVEVSFLIDLAR